MVKIFIGSGLFTSRLTILVDNADISMPGAMARLMHREVDLVFDNELLFAKFASV